MHLFGYLSVRAGLAFLLAFLLVLILHAKVSCLGLFPKMQTSLLVNMLQLMQIKEAHLPWVEPFSLLQQLSLLLLSLTWEIPYVWGGLITLVGFGFVGFKDDVGKILSGDNLEGLTPKQKMGLQAIVALIATGLLVYVGFPTEFYVPFIKTPLFDMGYFAIPFWVLMFLATTNAVNLTDGLDGLATVPSITALISLGLIVYITGHVTRS